MWGEADDVHWTLKRDIMSQIEEFNGRVCDDIPINPSNGAWLAFDDLNDLIQFKLKYL